MSIGVYRIVSPSGKCYVGMTCDSFENRWRGHLKELRNGRHKCSGLKHAFTKYGESAFIFETLEEFPSDTEPEFILQAEQQWWDKLSSEGIKLYNGRPTGTGSVYHTAETKDKISKASMKKLTVKYPDVKDFRKNASNRTEALKECGIEGCQNLFWGKLSSIYCSLSCRGKNSGVVLRKEFSYDEVYELYWNQKLSRREVGEILGIGRSTVGNLMKRLNIPMRSISEAQVGRSLKSKEIKGKPAWNKKYSCGHIHRDKCLCLRID